MTSCIACNPFICRLPFSPSCPLSYYDTFYFYIFDKSQKYIVIFYLYGQINFKIFFKATKYFLFAHIFIISGTLYFKLSFCIILLWLNNFL